MNQRQWAWDNHSEALCGEIKSRTFLHLSVCVWCVSGLAGSPWETGLRTTYPGGTLNTETTDASVHTTRLFSQVLFVGILFFRGFRAMWDAEDNIWEWELVLLAEGMCWSVSSEECDVLHPERAIMRVQMASWKVSSHVNSDILTFSRPLGVSGANIWSHCLCMRRYWLISGTVFLYKTLF